MGIVQEITQMIKLIYFITNKQSTELNAIPSMHPKT